MTTTSTSHRSKSRWEVYPVSMLPYGDDGKVKPFHVLRCMHQPRCDAELRLSPGEVSRLPPDAVMKRAYQRGWLADRRGYCLCPDHKPTGMSRLPPEQKRAAYCAIRDRNMAAAHDRDHNGAKNMELLKTNGDEVLARVNADTRLNDTAKQAFRALLPAILEGKMGKGWRARAAASISMNEVTFSGAVSRLIKRGYLVPIPGTYKLIIHREKGEAMTNEATTVETPPVEAPIIRAEPPPQPTLEANRRIRDFLDNHYDDAAGRWCGDWSDERAAKQLVVPRAWVSTVRAAFYGEDVNEAQGRQSEQAAELAEVAAKLKDDALAIATRAEELERACRKLIG